MSEHTVELERQVAECRRRWEPICEDSIGVTWGGYREHDKLCVACRPILGVLAELNAERERAEKAEARAVVVTSPTFAYKVLTHKHLDPICCEEGCQSLFLAEARQQIASLTRERDGARADLETKNAEAAAMREALEEIKFASGYCTLKDCGCSNHLAREALAATSAGADLLEKIPAPFAEPNPSRTDHRYTTHFTYTGSGCAMCGRPETEHAPAAEAGANPRGGE